MFERFTKSARHVVVLAQDEARGLNHNYIGTEHLLLALLREQQGPAARALGRLGITAPEVRQEVRVRIGPGQKPPKGHIPFTPRAKKVLELSLREAVALHHSYIGTEHLLLGLVREGSGVGAQILIDQAGDLAAVRMALLDSLPVTHGAEPARRWLRRRAGPRYTESAGLEEVDESDELRTTPAAEVSLDEAARLAGPSPVGSHHLLLATLSDPDTAAARALAALGVNLDQAREALRDADVTGTSDEAPEEAGRRQLTVRVSQTAVTLEATDPVLLAVGHAALDAVGDQAGPGGAIPGTVPAGAGLTAAWQALRDGLDDIRRRAGAAGPDDLGAEDQQNPQPRGLA
jgi:ATP-dependent Clp protease ATP-binding subunit ClpC